MAQALQDLYAEESICYGCGPASRYGLHIKSFIKGDKVVSTWHPEPQHCAFPNILNGGIIGTLLDCHCNWAACWYFMQDQELEHPPSTVTVEYSVKMLRPTPLNKDITLVAELERVIDNRAFINCKLVSNDNLCDTFHGVFVAVSNELPSCHRW